LIIGAPTEIKVKEFRIGLVPAGVKTLTEHGHQVLVQKDGGIGSGISNEAFIEAGAVMIDTKEEVWERADMIVKVKEPIEPEYKLMREGQILYTYLHLAAVPELVRQLVKRKVKAVAYETIQLDDGSLPALQPMSEVAGRMSIQQGAYRLEKEHGGKGVLLGGVPGVRRGRVVIIGGGVVGTNAAKIAVGFGAQVTILDVNLPRLNYLDDIFGSTITTLYSNSHNIRDSVNNADLLVGAVLIPGAKAPALVTEDMLVDMEDGSVVVDVAVDQGGCIATCKPTTHDDPTYIKHGIIHYCVANMPGAVSQTSTFALTNTTIGYAVKIADQGLEIAAKESLPLYKGINTYNGILTCMPVGESLDMPCQKLDL